VVVVERKDDATFERQLSDRSTVYLNVRSWPEADLWSKRVITISRKVDSLQIVVNINDVSGK
jgi:hypothetical protein